MICICVFSFQPGWEERVHSDGRIFYIDHSKQPIYYTYEMIELIIVNILWVHLVYYSFVYYSYLLLYAAISSRAICVSLAQYYFYVILEIFNVTTFYSLILLYYCTYLEFSHFDYKN